MPTPSRYVMVQNSVQLTRKVERTKKTEKKTTIEKEKGDSLIKLRR
jgi:hypothetical protein